MTTLGSKVLSKPKQSVKEVGHEPIECQDIRQNH